MASDLRADKAGLQDDKRVFVAVFVLPTAAVTLPPVVYPHFLSFILPLASWALLCFAFLCVSAMALASRKNDGSAPTLTLDDTSGSRNSNNSNRTSIADNNRTSIADGSRRSSMLLDTSEINVVDLECLESALASQPAERVLSRLFDTSELIRPMRIESGEPACSYAIISYRQVRSKHDSFTLDASAFRAAVKRARDAKVDALWLDGWCYRREGDYDHAAFCAELATVMRHVAAVIWLPRSRTNAPPSYQFRLWCSFEANVVAKRKLPVFIAGQGLAPSQIVLRRFGIFLPALVGLQPPKELRALAYINFGYEAACLLVPMFIPMVVFLIKSGCNPMQASNPRLANDADPATHASDISGSRGSAGSAVWARVCLCSQWAARAAHHARGRAARCSQNISLAGSDS